MSEVCFFSLDPMTKKITGGQVYDSNLLDIVNDIPGFNTSVLALREKGKAGPIKSLFKGLGYKAGDMIIFNSSKCLRFLPLPCLLRLIHRKTVYVIHHHFIYLEFSGIKRLVYKLGESAFLRSASKIIVPSPYIYAELKKKGFSDDRLVLLRIPFESKAQFPSQPVVGNLTFTGTIEPRKGIIYLLQALKKVKDAGIPFHLDIVGKTIDQKYCDMLHDYVARHGLDVSFRGFVSLEEKNRILSQTDIFVFPSLLEGFGMVLPEAQVYGLPIVCFDNSAMPFTVFNDVNGYTVPDRDTNTFADAVIRIISDRKLRNRLSQGALDNIARQNTWDEFRKQVTEFFQSTAPHT